MRMRGAVLEREKNKMKTKTKKKARAYRTTHCAGAARHAHCPLSKKMILMICREERTDEEEKGEEPLPLPRC